MVDFTKRLPPCPPQLCGPTSPPATAATSLLTDKREPPPLIRAPPSPSLSNVPQSETSPDKLQELPSLIGAPFARLDVVPGRDSGVDSIPATSGEASRCSTPRNGMEPSRIVTGSCDLEYQFVPDIDSTQGTYTRDGMECEPKHAPESDSQTKAQSWDSLQTVSLTGNNSSLKPNPQTALPNQIPTEHSSGYVSNHPFNPDQPPPLECAPIREDSSLYSPATVQVRASQSHTPSPSQCPRANTCFTAEHLLKEAALFPATQATTANCHLPRQQSSPGVGRGRALLALLESREALKETLVGRVMTSRASPPPKPGLGTTAPPPKPGLGPPPKPSVGVASPPSGMAAPLPKPGLGTAAPTLGRASPHPKPGLGRAQLLYSLHQQLSGTDSIVSRHERTVGSIALQRETERQDVNPTTNTSSTPTSSVTAKSLNPPTGTSSSSVTANFHPPSLEDFPVTATHQSPTAVVMVSSPLPAVDDPKPQTQQQLKRVKKPKIAAVFPGGSHAVSSPLCDTPSPHQADTPPTSRSSRVENLEPGSPTCVKSLRDEESSAGIVGLSQQLVTQSPLESPPPLLLKSPDGRLAAPSGRDSPLLQERRSSSEWSSPRSEHYQAVSSSDELEGGESRRGRKSHEIEKSIALHQRNIHRWQVGASYWLE